MPDVKDLIGDLRSLAAGIKQPANWFSGVRRNQGVAPDNVILYRKTDASSLMPTASSANYHHRFELVVILDNGGRARIGGTSYLLRPGESALIFPHQFHHYTDVDPGNMEWLFITFELDNPRPLAFLKDHPMVLDNEALILLEEIIRSYNRGLPSDPVSISLHLSLLLLHLVDARPIPADRCFKPSSEDIQDMIVEKINAYVRNNLNKAPSLEDLADNLGYSASHLRAIFRDKLGVTLGLYIRESRLSEASRLLLTTKRTVSKIAKETGFTSLNAFSRAFANYYGISPKAYGKKFSTHSSKN